MLVRSTLRTLVLALVATGIALTGTIASATPAAAAGPKVVIVVGPTNGATATYLARAKVIAAQARWLGASVTEIYTPKATWARVSAAAQGAKLFVYLGHGSGSPSPYTFDKAKSDGLGLNPTLDSGTTSPVKYYGESLIGSSIRFAPGAVVLLNHLCYASGSAEPGMAQPSWAVARQRVDNYAAGFIAAGAGAVIADAYVDVAYEVKAILTGTNMLATWRANPAYKGHERSFASIRRPGFTNYLDPDGSSSNFYRAITTTPGFSNAAPAPMAARTSVAVKLRTKPSETAPVVTAVRKGTPVKVIERVLWDSKGRTWAPVKLPSGQIGYVAGWLANFTGTAVPVANVIVRSSPWLTGTKVEAIGAGRRVTILGTATDRAFRVWLKVRTASGHTGWLASWLMRP